MNLLRFCVQDAKPRLAQLIFLKRKTLQINLFVRKTLKPFKGTVFKWKIHQVKHGSKMKNPVIEITRACKGGSQLRGSRWCRSRKGLQRLASNSWTVRHDVFVWLVSYAFDTKRLITDHSSHCFWKVETKIRRMCLGKGGFWGRARKVLQKTSEYTHCKSQKSVSWTEMGGGHLGRPSSITEIWPGDKCQVGSLSRCSGLSHPTLPWDTRWTFQTVCRTWPSDIAHANCMTRVAFAAIRAATLADFWNLRIARLSLMQAKLDVPRQTLVTLTGKIRQIPGCCEHGQKPADFWSPATQLNIWRHLPLSGKITSAIRGEIVDFSHEI